MSKNSLGNAEIMSDHVPDVCGEEFMPNISIYIYIPCICKMIDGVQENVFISICKERGMSCHILSYPEYYFSLSLCRNE